MKHHAHLPPVDWVKRVNRSWIVHSDLNGKADAWVEYLAGLDDGRLERSCEMARAMCDLRDPMENPKPWFYSGLFHLATVEEAQRFLEAHRVTQASVPAMGGDVSTRLWLDRSRPETRELLDRLRAALTRSRPRGAAVDQPRPGIRNDEQ